MKQTGKKALNERDWSATQRMAARRCAFDRAAPQANAADDADAKRPHERGQFIDASTLFLAPTVAGSRLGALRAGKILPQPEAGT